MSLLAVSTVNSQVLVQEPSVSGVLRFPLSTLSSHLSCRTENTKAVVRTIGQRAQGYRKDWKAGQPSDAGSTGA